jgi:hypothetical protein
MRCPSFTGNSTTCEWLNPLPARGCGIEARPGHEMSVAFVGEDVLEE